jgi:Lar family restriction alleviation protein
MSTELKPCPFCGGTNIEVAFYNRPCVVCLTCDANGPSAQWLNPVLDHKNEVEEKAKELWNWRTDPVDPLWFDANGRDIRIPMREEP